MTFSFLAVSHPHQPSFWDFSRDHNCRSLRESAYCPKKDSVSSRATKKETIYTRYIHYENYIYEKLWKWQVTNLFQILCFMIIHSVSELLRPVSCTFLVWNKSSWIYSHPSKISFIIRNVIFLSFPDSRYASPLSHVMRTAQSNVLKQGRTCLCTLNLLRNRFSDRYVRRTKPVGQTC